MLYLSIFLELLGGYLLLFVVVKLLGKTQISQISPFDFISALVMGELVGSAIYDPEAGFGMIVTGVLIWGALIYLTELVTQKSRKLRFKLEGRPAVIINKGKLDWKEMKRNHLDLDQLQQLLRSKDIFALKDVEYAILENNGAVSVLRKTEADQATCGDLNIQGKERILPYTVISDGVVLKDNLQNAGVSQEWLQHQLKTKGYDRLEEISYAEYEPGDDLYIQTY
ncbi:YetF domain-containing protein [Mesobacillus foraminis]|uniref:YetF domain-containing protein n=1 Tax=Mesobacillus foraminis TaxID=279826 RepID=UPI00353081A9